MLALSVRFLSSFLFAAWNDEAGAMSSFSLASKLPIPGHQGPAPSYHIYPQGIDQNTVPIQALHLFPLHNNLVFFTNESVLTLRPQVVTSLDACRTLSNTPRTRIPRARHSRLLAFAVDSQTDCGKTESHRCSPRHPDDRSILSQCKSQ
jgi:hypothetical protein